LAQALGDLVELGHSRVGEALVEASTTPVLGLGIGGLCDDSSLPLCWFRCRLVRGRLLSLALLLFVREYVHILGFVLCVYLLLVVGCERAREKGRDTEIARDYKGV
jgi:hypothetical protein